MSLSDWMGTRAETGGPFSERDHHPANDVGSMPSTAMTPAVQPERGANATVQQALQRIGAANDVAPACGCLAGRQIRVPGSGLAYQQAGAATGLGVGSKSIAAVLTTALKMFALVSPHKAWKYLSRLRHERKAMSAWRTSKLNLLDDIFDTTLDRLANYDEPSWWRKVFLEAEGDYVLPHENADPHFLRIPAVREWLTDHQVRADLKALATEIILAVGTDTGEIRARLARSDAQHTLEHPVLAEARIDTVVNGIVAGALSSLAPSERLVVGLMRESNQRINQTNAQALAALSRLESNRSADRPYAIDAIDKWRVLTRAYMLEDEASASDSGWELPRSAVPTIEALEDEVGALLEEAQNDAGERPTAPASASKPIVNLYNRARPAKAIVVGNYQLTAADASSEIRHIILDFGDQAFPVLEGQSIGIVPPGLGLNGKPHAMRQYCVASPRDGEKPNANMVALTVKRESGGICSNFLCDLSQGASVEATGPYGTSFLMPNDPSAILIMICTGTGPAPFRAFIERRRRAMPKAEGRLLLFFGASRSEELPYFGPLQKIPKTSDKLAALLRDQKTFVYICGLKGIEAMVDKRFSGICSDDGTDWNALKNSMRSEGRYHVQAY